MGERHIRVAINGYFEGWKLLVWWKVICSEGNQFGKDYMWMWSWNRNVDPGNVFEKELESIWKCQIVKESF